MSRSFALPVMLIFISMTLIGCDNSQSTPSTLSIDQVEKEESGWPRSIMTSKGLLTLEKAPKRIVSTSVTMTGTLLALDAPIVASGATMANTSVASEQGFMHQWDNIAISRGITSLYQAEPNAEAIIRAKPDLIIISVTGADSAIKLYDQLKDIAPTLVIRYDNKSWMQLAQIFGDLLGLEQQAKTIIEDFQQNINETKSIITLPPQPTTAMVYYQDGSAANIWTNESAQGRLLSDLGFTLATIPDEIKGDISMGVRSDIVIASGELFPDALTGKSILLFSANQERETDLKNNSYLNSVEAIKNEQVFAVGFDTFRLDYYSASNLLSRLQDLFGQQNNEQ